ncbi:uncharacterized protein LOC132277481 [Cornus florida]|uniref:uncharacterized protein LOC132277481 n=1 Tax=Cornus florida TaxID=4283 RepID=UPI00289FA451|nr:uncharacterized protein LOC132277481 [Cornus florida]
MQKQRTIKEAHNLNTLELDELLGSLLTWEITLKDREGDHHRKKEIALKKFNKGRFKKGESSNEQSKRDTSTYFHCGKLGHFKADCHVYKEEKKKRRAMQATWEDDDSNGSESDNEKAILCLMANRDEVNSNYDSSSECEMSYDDLVDAYNGLLDGFKELHDELGKMVKKCASQRREKLIIESKFQTLLNENECLKKECTLLKETGSPELISENASLKLIIEDQIDGLAKKYKVRIEGEDKKELTNLYRIDRDLLNQMGLKKSEDHIWYNPKFGNPTNEGQDIVMTEHQAEGAEVGGNADSEEEQEEEEEGEEEEEEDQQESMNIPLSEERSLRELLLESITLLKEQIAIEKENKDHILALCE